MGACMHPFVHMCLHVQMSGRADMGQSRILAIGETAVRTGSQGGTWGWMSPEEIEWDNGGSLCGEQFVAHLSGDIHSAGSILFYILSGGAHCFGSNKMLQPINITEGNPDFRMLDDGTHATMHGLVCAYWIMQCWRWTSWQGWCSARRPTGLRSARLLATRSFGMQRSSSTRSVAGRRRGAEVLLPVGH